MPAELSSLTQLSLVETARSPREQFCSDGVHATTSLLVRKCYEVVRVEDTNIFAGAVTGYSVNSAESLSTSLASLATLLEGVRKHLPKPVEVLANLFWGQIVYEAGLDEESLDVLLLQFGSLLGESIIVCVV